MALTMSIDFAANIARLVEDSKKTANAVQQMAEQIDVSVDFAKGALRGLTGALSVAAFTAAIKSSIDLADSLNDLSKRTGASVETLSGLRLAAEQSGTSLEAIANGSKKLATSLVENQAAFQKLGINTKSQTEALIQLGDVFTGMDDPVQRSALAVKLFGKAGDEMIPLLLEGSEGIRGMIERGQELGGVTTQMARQADQFNDSLSELKLRSQGFYITLANQLLPQLNETVSAFNDLQSSGSAAADVGKAISAVFETVVIVGANVAYVFKQTGNEIGGIAAQLGALASGDFKAFSRIGEEMKRDAEIARQELDKFEQRVMGAGKGKDQGGDKAAEAGSNTRGQQLLKDLTGASDELAKLRQKDIDGWVKYADAVLAEGERIDAMLRKQIEDQNALEAARELTWTQGVAARLAVIQESNMTEAEIERGKLTQIQTDLQFALDQRFITEQEYHALLEQEKLKHEARMGNVMAQGALARQKISQQSWMSQAQTASQWLMNMTASAATSNREMFEINKAAGISNAIVNTYQAATGAYAALASIPYVGPFLGAAAAAVAIAAGMANVQAISSAQFGSSTSAPSIGGGQAIPVTSADPGGASGMPLAAVPETEKARREVNITFAGSGRYTYDEVVNGIAPLLKEAGDNGALDVRVGFTTAT